MNKALFWDFDGTLVQRGSRPLWSSSLLRALKESWPDCPCVLEDVRPHLRACFPWDTPQENLTHLTGEAWWAFMRYHFEKACLALGADGETAGRAAEKVRGFVLEMQHYTLYEDVLSVLQTMAELGFEQYVVSNNHPDLFPLVEELGLAQYFSAVIVSGEIGYDKPRREIYELALQKAGNPGFCYMIGDNPYADGEGAQNAGITPLLVHLKQPAEGFLCFDTLFHAAQYIQEELHAATQYDHRGL